MSRFLSAGALCAAAVLLSAPADAAVFASLTFDQPTGTVFSNQSIDIYVTLHLAANSDAIRTDPFGTVTSGLTDQDIIDAGADPLTVVRTNVNNSFECSGTFVEGCGGGASAYNFDFNFTAPSFVGAANLDLEPGSDTSFFFGTFSPVGGNAAPGLYSYFSTAFFFQISNPNPDYDPNDPNSQVNIVRSVNIANTCTGQDPACAFNREVLAAPGVPEPANWALMILGFGGAGAMLRRRRAAAA
jgi:hypothetical protein